MQAVEIKPEAVIAITVTKPEVTLFCPFTRGWMIDRWTKSIEALDYDKTKMRLAILVDSDEFELWDRLGSWAAKQGFHSYVVKPTMKPKRQTYDHSAEVRRNRIVEVKGLSKQIIGQSEFVFGIEDDTIVPPDSLKKMMAFMWQNQNVGFIEGAEVNRWGFKVMGAWRCDDLAIPTRMGTIPFKDEGVEEIDGGGFYCYLTRAHLYKQATYQNNGIPFGVDVSYGISLRELGYQNYIDWSIKCEHYYLEGLADQPKVLIPDSSVATATWVLKDGKWVLEAPVGARK